MATERSSGRLLSIQAARGVASLAVICYHAGRGVALPQYVGSIPLGGFFNFGHAGVDFFFVLSGFIIYFVHHRDIGRPASLPRYAWRRLTRVLPIYWVVTAITLALGTLRPGGSPVPGGGYLLASLLLLPQAQDPPVGVAWTLVYEMFFYAFFALAIASRRLGALVATAWIGLVVLAQLFPTSAVWDASAVLRLAASSLNMHFLLGAVAAHLVLTAEIRRPRLLALVGMAGFFAAGLAENAHLVATASPASRLLFGGTAALIVLGLAAAERQGRLRVGPVAAFLGNASYSLYLIHVTAIGLVARLLMLAGVVKVLPGELVLLLAVAAGIVSGAALYQFVERPLTRWLTTLGRVHIFA